MWGLGWDMQICGCSRAGDVKGACVFVCVLTGRDCISVPLCSWEIAVNSNAFSLHFLDFAGAIQSIRLWINFHISTKHGSNPTLWVQISQQHPLNQRKRREKKPPTAAACSSLHRRLLFLIKSSLILSMCLKQVLAGPIFSMCAPQGRASSLRPPPRTSKRPQTRGVQVMGRWTGGHPM